MSPHALLPRSLNLAMFEFLEAIHVNIRRTCAAFSLWAESVGRPVEEGHVPSDVEELVTPSDVEELVTRAMLGCQQMVQRNRLLLFSNEEQMDGRQSGLSSNFNRSPHP